MKSKAQKQKELNEGRELLKKSRILIFADFSKMPAEKLRELRKTMRNLGVSFLVIKKRLLNILFQEKGINFDARQFKSSVGTMFSPEDEEEISAPVFQFFFSLGADAKSRKEWPQKILGGYDLKNNNFIEAERILFIGQLPAREILLAQLLGMLAAPIRSFLYVLNQKSKQMVENK